MKATRKTTQTITTLTAAGIALSFLPAVHAQTISFNNTPASSAAMAMSKRYGVTIVFRGSINTGQPVTFSVDNADTPDGRLQAVSNLANALNLDFQKVYVVSKIDPGAAVPAVPVDSDGPIVFTSTHIPVREAIQTVASVDNALTQISSLITGDVTLPSTHMTAFEAAAAISKQTGTEWKAYYGLFKRSETPARFSGEIIGQTNDGQPIRVLPLLTFRSTVPVTVPLHSGEEAVVGPLDPFSGDPTVASVPNTNFDTAPDTGFGFGDPYGYTNPYGVYGYATPDGTIAAPGAVVTPGVGVSPAVPGVNAPGATAVAGPTGATFAPVP
jgi:hypothetical protein